MMDEIFRDIIERHIDVPYGNTDYIYEVHEYEHKTPAMAYLFLIKQCTDRMKAIQLNQISHQEEVIRLNRVRLALKALKPFRFVVPGIVRLMELKIQKHEIEKEYLRGLVADAYHSLGFLYGKLKEMPRYTREEIEAEAPVYFEHRWKREARGLTGAKSMLELQNVSWFELDEYRKNPQLLKLSSDFGKMEEIAKLAKGTQ